MTSAHTTVRPVKNHSFFTRWLARPLLALIVAAAVAGLGDQAARVAAAPDPSCQTSFLVFADPNNFGDVTTTGDIVRAKNSGILGQYTSGRFAGYTISGLQDLVLNQANGKATIKGSFVATSPDGQSSFTLLYSGRANLITTETSGRFRAVNGTGEAAGLRTSGDIVATYLGNFTFTGVDIGLC